LASLIEKSAYDSNKTHLEPKNAILFARTIFLNNSKTEKCLFRLRSIIFNADLVRRLDKLLSAAHHYKIPVLIDAEQSFHQKAIDWFALALSKRFNKEMPIVYNTYQLYLKEGLTKLQRDMEIAKADQFFFAAKVELKSQSKSFLRIFERIRIIFLLWFRLCVVHIWSQNEHVQRASISKIPFILTLNLLTMRTTQP
jgi:hypothetical protein